MKLIIAALVLAVCIGFRTVQAGPTPKLAYPWTSWLALRPAPPLPLAYAPYLQPAAGAPGPATSGESPETLNYLIARAAVAPVSPWPKKKAKKKGKGSSEEVTTTTTTTTSTKRPALIDVADFWTLPTAAPNTTSPAVADPAFWAAKKTMFISRLFAALAKQVLNSTGTMTTTTPSPNDALLKEIDTVLLSDVARSLVGAGPPALAKETAKAAKKAAKKEAAKAKKKAAKVKGPPAFVLAKKPTPAPAPEPAVEDSAEESDESGTAKPTLDYSSLAKALLA